MPLWRGGVGRQGGGGESSVKVFKNSMLQKGRSDQKVSDAIERPSLLLGGAVPGCEGTGIQGDWAGGDSG